ncbi:MAG: cellulase family glycosylhydrolase, partial [Bacteroidota bacterium]
MKTLPLLLTISLALWSCKSGNKEIVQNEKQIEAKISFWQEQQKGTNFFNQTPSTEWFDAANEANIKFVRLVYDKWKGEEGYFLVGNADQFSGIVEKDFAKLKTYLDYANTLDIKVVICPITIPGEIWVQSNNGKKDGRLWTASGFVDQVAHFWKDLALRLKDHPAIVGYNLVNEPHPEIYFDKYSFWDADLAQWYKSVEGSPADLNVFNEKVVQSIRMVDTETPIILESGFYATPWAFDYLRPINDEKIIYSFHMYEPYAFTTKRINKGQYAYPGKMIIDDTGEEFGLNRESLAQFFHPVKAWAKEHEIPSNRIWVGEFGCNRHVEGVEHYLADLISIFNENEWHWSFYAYREDTWEAMDYELGTEK